MFGLFMAILWIVVACAIGIKNIKYNNDSRNRALRDGKNEYIDANHRDRDVDDGALSYRHRDWNGDTWKVYPGRNKPNVNLTRKFKDRLNQELEKERIDYAEKNRMKAVEGRWRFYRIKKNSPILDSGTQRDYPRDYKGYETAGADIFKDRMNSHECILFGLGLGAFCIYDTTDDKMYDWYFKTKYNSKTAMYDGDSGVDWGCLEQSGFRNIYCGVNDPKAKSAFLKTRGEKRMTCDAIYKYGEQTEYRYSQSELSSMLDGTFKYHQNEEE